MKTEQYVKVVEFYLNANISVDMLSNGHIRLVMRHHNARGYSSCMLWIRNKRTAGSVVNWLGSRGTFNLLEGTHQLAHASVDRVLRCTATLGFVPDKALVNK